MKTVFISKDDIDATLSKPPVKGKNLLEPFQSFAVENKLPFSILEDTAVENDAEVHKTDGDLWFCLEGEATFVCGGKLIEPYHRVLRSGAENPDELYGPGISDGEKFILKPGDWLWIPPGEAHQHGATGTTRLIIIKISAQSR